jgi:hypothetical protein
MPHLRPQIVAAASVLRRVCVASLAFALCAAAAPATVEAVTSRGMRVLATILYTPPWARPDGTPAGHAPTNLVDYANFVRAAVRR